MKKELTHKMLESDIRHAKGNLKDPKAIEKLRENMKGSRKQKEAHTLTKEELKHADEEHRLHKLSRFIVNVSEAHELAEWLKGSLTLKDFKKVKMYLYRLTQSIKALSVHTEEDKEIFSKLMKEVEPLLSELEKNQEHRHLFSHIQRLHSIAHEKLDPQKWKHAA